VPLNGGVAIKSEIAPAIKEELEKVAIGAGAEFSIGTSNFSWGSSGKAIYFDQAFRGARNIWKMTIDPATLRATAIERLTAGPGPDTGAVVSPDGKRLAFTAQSEHIRSLLRLRCHYWSHHRQRPGSDLAGNDSFRGEPVA
jgi:Tol biopolymer transport system component